ncbi:uncharacterized protein LOC144109931 isoform X2 [Amblyomma americanum]
MTACFGTSRRTAFTFLEITARRVCKCRCREDLVQQILHFRDCQCWFRGAADCIMAADDGLGECSFNRRGTQHAL